MTLDMLHVAKVKASGDGFERMQCGISTKPLRVAAIHLLYC